MPRTTRAAALDLLQVWKMRSLKTINAENISRDIRCYCGDGEKVRKRYFAFLQDFGLIKATQEKNIYEIDYEKAYEMSL